MAETSVTRAARRAANEKRVVRRTTRLVQNGALIAPTMIALTACPGPKDPHDGTTCDGQSRPQLNCESEFKYEGRKVEGGFSALGLGSVTAKTDEAALRAIDKETEQYAAQSRRLCDEYNKCVIDKDSYSVRAENLRRRMSKAPELYDAVKNAPEGEGRKKALASAYTGLVAEENRRELSFDFSVEAQRPSDGASHPITQGERLPTGTRIAFIVRPSKNAHVYLFQKGPDGHVDVLFPEARIAMKNPLAGGSLLRLPSGDKTFKLNDKDIGTERVFIVASLDPVNSLDRALTETGGASSTTGPLAQVTEARSSEKAAGCTRALELDESAPKCSRSRGIELDESPVPTSHDGNAPASFRARTEAADSVIVQVFAFEHTR